MAELVSGAKSGVISGSIYGVINTVVINVVVTGLIFPTVFPEFFVGGLRFLRITVVAVWLIGGLIIGAFGGLVFGLIFAVLHGRLPGKTPKIKGIILSIVFWVIFGLTQQLALSARWPPEAVFLISMPIMTSLGTSVLWGILLGTFWERLSLEPETS